MSDLDATVTWAEDSGVADPAKVGITGFCWGGRIVWLYAAHKMDLKAGVAWYGRLTGDKTPNQPAHPVDLASRIKAPVLGLYGGADTGIPVSTIEEMKNALGMGTASSFHLPGRSACLLCRLPALLPRDRGKGRMATAQAWFHQHGLA